jgi:cyclopropane fatty-acyl-phospholipid synthase-like methyltransferase
VQQEVDSVYAIDFDPVFVRDVNTRMEEQWKFECVVHDILTGPIENRLFDAAYSIDVFEHIPIEAEGRFISNICSSLADQGVLIIGSPSLESQKYASEASKAGHINCKSGDEMRALMLEHFHNVFVFSMNDEVVHTGFYPMAHYHFSVCSGKK